MYWWNSGERECLGDEELDDNVTSFVVFYIMDEQ